MLKLKANGKGNALAMQTERYIFKLYTTGQSDREIGLTWLILLSEKVRQERF